MPTSSSIESRPTDQFKAPYEASFDEAVRLGVPLTHLAEAEWQKRLDDEVALRVDRLARSQQRPLHTELSDEGHVLIKHRDAVVPHTVTFNPLNGETTLRFRFWGQTHHIPLETERPSQANIRLTDDRGSSSRANGAVAAQEASRAVVEA